MTTIAFTFDTLAFAKQLEQGGFTPEQSAAQAKAQGELFAQLIEEKLATKEDIHRLELATKQDIRRLELATKEDIRRLEQTMATKDDLARFEKATKEDIHRLEIATKNDISRLEKDILKLSHHVDALGLTLTVRLGGMLVVAIGALATIMKVF